MVNYRRNFQRGGTYFFTVNLLNRRSDLLIKNIHYLKKAIQQVKRVYPYKMQAYVILPEHLHVLWKLPYEDVDYATRWQKIKIYFTRYIQKAGVKVQRNKHGECLIWQRRYWEHTIYDAQDFQNHFNYIHYNPVKHGWVERPIDWPFSSIHHYIEKGMISPSWGANESIELPGTFGE